MWGNTESFTDWSERTHRQLIARAPADVPCGTCTACCRAGQFIHVGVQEAAARVIPEALLVPAPGVPGQLLLGHRPSGECPMLIDNQCSIYADRPLACRSYDCRIFSAADTYPDASQPEVATRARGWSFHYADHGDQSRHQAVKNAARFLKQHAATIFSDPVNEIQLSLAALKIRDVFNAEDSSEPDRAQIDYEPAAESAAFVREIKALLQP